MSGSPLQWVMTTSPGFTRTTFAPTPMTSANALLPGKIFPPRTSAMLTVSARAA
jgi:hypothetical protein